MNILKFNQSQLLNLKKGFRNGLFYWATTTQNLGRERKKTYTSNWGNKRTYMELDMG